MSPLGPFSPNEFDSCESRSLPMDTMSCGICGASESIAGRVTGRVCVVLCSTKWKVCLQRPVNLFAPVMEEMCTFCIIRLDLLVESVPM